MESKVLLFLTLGFLPALDPASAGTAPAGDKCSITGTVLDRSGKPVRGASIDVSCREHNYSRTVRTGRDGTYKIEGLKPGHYSLSLMKDRGGRYASRHKMRRIEAGEEVQIDFTPLAEAAAMCGESEGNNGCDAGICHGPAHIRSARPPLG